MIIKKIIQIAAMEISIVVTCASVPTSTCVNNVEITIKSGIGYKQYEDAIKMSLRLPSPSNKVVKHQLAIMKRKNGKTS